MHVRTRIAPSPTGDPHVGTAYMSLFNLAFVLPLMAIVAVRVAAGDRAAPRLERFRQRVARYAGTVLAVLLGAGGAALIAVGLGLF